MKFKLGAVVFCVFALSGCSSEKSATFASSDVRADTILASYDKAKADPAFKSAVNVLLEAKLQDVGSVKLADASRDNITVAGVSYGTLNKTLSSDPHFKSDFSKFAATFGTLSAFYKASGFGTEAITLADINHYLKVYKLLGAGGTNNLTKTDLLRASHTSIYVTALLQAKSTAFALAASDNQTVGSHVDTNPQPIGGNNWDGNRQQAVAQTNTRLGNAQSAFNTSVVALQAYFMPDESRCNANTAGNYQQLTTVVWVCGSSSEGGATPTYRWAKMRGATIEAGDKCVNMDGAAPSHLPPGYTAPDNVPPPAYQCQEKS